MTTLLWIESGSCSGESMSILVVDGTCKESDNILGFIEKYNIELLWHPSLSSESPKEVSKTFDRILAGEQELTLLCIEGSIINGPDGTGMYDTFDGRPK